MENKKVTPEDLKQHGYSFVADVGEPNCDGICLQLWTDGEINIIYDPATQQYLLPPPFV